MLVLWDKPNIAHGAAQNDLLFIWLTYRSPSLAGLTQSISLPSVLPPSPPSTLFFPSHFLSDHTPKPFGITEACGVSGVAAAKDCNAQLHITFTSGGYASCMVSKYRPAVPQVGQADHSSLRKLHGILPARWHACVQTHAAPCCCDGLFFILSPAALTPL